MNLCLHRKAPTAGSGERPSQASVSSTGSKQARPSVDSAPGAPSGRRLPPRSGAAPGVLRYCKFTLSGFPGVKQAVLFPESLDIDAKVATTVFSTLKIPRPNLLIENCGVPVHPYYLLGDEEFGASTFDSFRAHGLTGDELDQKKVARECMVRKMKAAAGAVMSAAEQTGSATYHYLCPSAFDMLAASLVQSELARPLSIGGIHANDSLFQWQQSVDMFQAISDEAVPLDPASVESFGEPLALDGSFLAAAYNLSEPFSGSIIMESAGDAILPPEKRHPMSQWIYAGTDLYFIAHKVRADGSPDVISRETNPDNYAYGTNTCLDPVKRHDVLAPSGVIFVNGCSSFTRQKMMQCIETAVPAVIVGGSGGHSNVMSKLLEMVVAVIRDNVSELADMVGEDTVVRRRMPVDQRFRAIKPQLMLAKALERAHVDPKMPCQITVSDVLALLDSAAARPNVFLQTIKVVDPMLDSPETCLEQLSSCFASTHTGTVELGASSTHADVLMEAWRTHQQLSLKAGTLRSRSLLVTVLAASLSWLGIVTAVCCSSVEFSGDDGPAVNVLRPVLEYGNVIVPILSGLILTVRSRFMFLEKWAICATACGEIVREIYCFRAAIGDYSHSAHQTVQEADDRKEGGGVVSSALLAKKARMRFVDRISEIVSRVVSAGLKDTSVASTGSARVTPQTLPAYVSRVLYTRRPERRSRCCCPSRRRRRTTTQDTRTVAPAARVAEAAVPLRIDEMDEDETSEDGDDAFEDGDPLDPINAETYFASRTAMLISLFEGQVPTLAMQQDMGDLLLFVCSCVASLFGAFNQPAWIPVVLGLAGFITVIVNHANARHRLIATNSALAGLRSIQLQWVALSNVEKRTFAFKQHLITTTEQTVLSVLTASTAISGFSKAVSSDGASEEASGRGKQRAQKKDRANEKNEGAKAG